MTYTTPRPPVHRDDPQVDERAPGNGENRPGQTRPSNHNPRKCRGNGQGQHRSTAGHGRAHGRPVLLTSLLLWRMYCTVLYMRYGTVRYTLWMQYGYRTVTGSRCDERAYSVRGAHDTEVLESHIHFAHSRLAAPSIRINTQHRPASHCETCLDR